MTTGAIKGAEVGFSNSSVPMQRLGWRSHSHNSVQNPHTFPSPSLPITPFKREVKPLDKKRKLAQSWNQIQTLKVCFCCHIYCAQVSSYTILQIYTLLFWGFCSNTGLFVQIPGLSCVRGLLKIFVKQKLSNLSALPVLSPVNMQ